MLNERINEAKLVGRIVESFKFDHSTKDSTMYSTVLEVKRKSENVDRIRVLITYELYCKIGKLDIGTAVVAEGEIRTYSGDGHLRIYIFATKMNKLEDDTEEINQIRISGYVCRPPIYRITPLTKRMCCDVMIAVPRAHFNKADYIPCIAWGRNAEYVSDLPAGTEVEFEGRIQSREYQKKIRENEIVTKTAIEVSCNLVSII